MDGTIVAQGSSDPDRVAGIEHESCHELEGMLDAVDDDDLVGAALYAACRLTNVPARPTPLSR